MAQNNNSFKHGLTEKELNIIASILSPYAEKLERVDVFGSRANGNYRQNSDIDMVLHGQLSETDIDRLYTLFNESDLSLKVDVALYSALTYPPLQRHIDSAAKTLFTQEQLVQHMETNP